MLSAARQVGVVQMLFFNTDRAGVGKSTSVRLVASALSCDIVEWAAPVAVKPWVPGSERQPRLDPAAPESVFTVFKVQSDVIDDM